MEGRCEFHDEGIAVVEGPGQKRVIAYALRSLLHDFGEVLVQREDLYDLRELQDWDRAITAVITKALNIVAPRLHR